MSTLAEAIKNEILTDMSNGVVPYTVNSFSELHDYVDANCYGGLCNERVMDGLISFFGGRDADEAMPDGLMAYINNAQDIVDGWLRGYHE